MKKTLLAIAILILVLGLAVFATLDTLVGRAIERGAHAATGVPTRVGGVSIGLLRGELGVSGVEVDNPQGYESPFLLRLEQLELGVHPRSLMEPVVRVPRLVADQIRLNLERQGTDTNFGTVLANIRRNVVQGPPTPQTEAEPKRFIIDELRITGISAQALLARDPLGRGQAETALPDIVLRDVGAESGGVTLPQLAALVARELLEQVRQSGVLPAELQQRLESALGQVQGLERRLREQAGEAEQQVRERAQQEIEGQRERLLEQGRQILEGR